MTPLLKTSDWALDLFGEASLGDKRLNRRLVTLAHQMGEHIGKSLVKSCGGDEAKLEGAYRFIRNKRIQATHKIPLSMQKPMPTSTKRVVFMVSDMPMQLINSNRVYPFINCNYFSDTVMFGSP